MNRFRIFVFQTFILLATPAVLLAADESTIRFATFNIAMGLNEQGELNRRLQSGQDEALKKVAAIIQKVRPDVLLLNEFDCCEADSAMFFINNYLALSQHGQKPIGFAHVLDGDVNTGQNSGLDLNNNDIPGEPADAWGFGRFPGQFGMKVLSRFPMSLERNLQFFKWTDMPDSLLPLKPDGSPWYTDEIREQFLLSSKSHWDIGVTINDHLIHFLVSHPTPPVFDGPEDRNGKRNHDEIRLWADYIDPQRSAYIIDGNAEGGLEKGARFIIAGDLNADPVDGESYASAIGQLLEHPLIDASCVPVSTGAVEASDKQGGKNLENKGDPAADTGDFNDQYVGNMRIDYVLPSSTLTVGGCGVFWPTSDQKDHQWLDASDHHLVWIDIRI